MKKASAHSVGLWVRKKVPPVEMTERSKRQFRRRIIGRAIRLQREKENFPVEVIATAIGIHPRFYQMIEQGRWQAPLTLLIQIVEELGVHRGAIENLVNGLEQLSLEELRRDINRRGF